MIPAIGRTMTTGAEMETVSPENAGAPSYASGGSAHHTGRRRRLGRRKGETRSWSPNTRRTYVAGWNDFTS